MISAIISHASTAEMRCPSSSMKPPAFGLGSLESRNVFAADLVLSGDLDAMTTQLSWRLAAAAAAEKDSVGPDAIEAEQQRFFERSGISPEELPQWLEQLGRDLQWFDRMSELEAAYRQRNAT